jgi:nucleotide-binding universal stress UspA family protein
MKPQIRKLLYATDLSENSDNALQYALQLAKNNNAEIVSLHVIEEVSSNMPILLTSVLAKEQIQKFFSERRAFALERMKSQFKTFCETQFKDDPDCFAKLSTFEVCGGYPADVILKMAKELNCDVIVMGTHGKGLISQTFLGSEAKRVLRRARIPVFIVPLTEEDDTS